MMVEFIGSTGAGKSTVAVAVERRLAESALVEAAPDLVGRLVGLPRLRKPLHRNLVCDLVGLPFVLGSLPRHGAYLRFTLLALGRQRLALQLVNRVRSTLRKVGVYEIARRYGSSRVVLVDEGTVLHAHNLFVYSSRSWSSEELEAFARVVPLPDLIVHVRAPVEVSIRRSLSRSDPPREMRSRDRALVELYVRRAREMFEALADMPVIRERVVVVDNPGDVDGACEPQVSEVVQTILARAGRASSRS